MATDGSCNVAGIILFLISDFEKKMLFKKRKQNKEWYFMQHKCTHIITAFCTAYVII